MSILLKAGLVRRYKGRYFLTAFGKVVYNARMNFETKIEDAINNYWKLKAIDFLEMPPRDETEKVISVLIDNQEIKGILMKEMTSNLSNAPNLKDHRIKQSMVTVPNCV
jgi:hypothetical protein